MLTRDEITALARSNAKTMREYLATQLAPIHQRQSTAADAGRVSELQQHPEKLRPWKSEGREWHISQKGMSRRQTPKWKPPLLLALIGRFKSIQPELELDWSGKTGISLSTPGRKASLGKIVTNMGRGLRIELRTPKNVMTPAQVDRLGEDVEIRRHGHDDWIIFWVRSLSDMDSGQLRSVWRQCTTVSPTESLQSA